MTAAAGRTPALLAVAHGTSSVAGRAAVGALVAAVRSAADAPVRGGFVDVQPPDVARLLAGVPGDGPVVIVPLLLSAGYHVHVDITDAARSADREVVVAGALGPDDGLVALLARRLAEAGADPRDAVVLAVAGSSDAAAVADCHDVARLLAAVLRREVRIGFLSAAEPRLDAAIAAARKRSRRVVVATYLLAPGYFHDMVRAAGAEVVAAPLLADSATPPVEVVEAVLARYRSAVARDLSLCAD